MLLYLHVAKSELLSPADAANLTISTQRIHIFSIISVIQLQFTDAGISIFTSWFGLLLWGSAVKPGTDFLSCLSVMIVNWIGLKCFGDVEKTKQTL